MADQDPRIEQVARAIQNAWAEWARTLPNAPKAWCREWEDVSEEMREVDRKLARAAVSAYLETL